MKISKFFSGELLDISYYIVRQLRNDLKSLYSCVLVNRFLCKIAIPILWEDPFSVKRILRRDSHSPKFFDIYLFYFGEEDKATLRKLGIFINPEIKRPLFNYPSFIKTLNTFRLELHTVNLLNYSFPSNKKNRKKKSKSNQVESDKVTFQSKYVEITSLLIKKDPTSSKKIMEFICISLFKIFISNNASLNNLSIKVNDSCGHFLTEIFETILVNTRFISGVEILNLEFDFLDLNFKHIQPFLASLPSFLSSIKHFRICSNHYDGTLSNNLTNIIQSQTQLLSFSLSYIYNTVDTLYSSKNLTSLHFFKCNFTNLLSCEGHLGLTQLKSLSFMRCEGLTAQVSQQLFIIPTPLKIKSLRVEDACSGVGLLIQEFSPYLENLELKLWEIADREIALESIINYCNRIKFLYLAKLNNEDIPKLYKLITQNCKLLKYLTLQPTNTDGLQVCSNLLRDLGPKLPHSLEYLNLCLKIDPNDLYSFLCDIMHVDLKSLLFKNNHDYNVDITFGVLKEFVMEKKIKNFAYQVNGYFDSNNLEHFKLDCLVNEFQHFTELKRYDDLILGISDFDDAY